MAIELTVIGTPA